MNNEENFAVNIERIFDAQIEKVWDAWADGEKMHEWSCPNGFNIIEHSGKFEVGETYNVTMKSDFYEGTIAGKFLKIEKPNKIVQTHFWDNKDGTFTVETFVTIVFKEINGKTKMTFAQTGFENAERAESHKSGWSECFDKLDSLLAS